MEESPAVSIPLPPPPSPPVPAAGWCRAVRLLRAPVLFAWRRPARAALLFLSLSLFAAAVALGGLRLWFGQHLRAARQAVDQGHNAAALQHLRACRWAYPDHPKVLLLAARVARRAGSAAESEELLDEYSKRHGTDDSLVAERLMLRAARGETEATAPLLLARIKAGEVEETPAREAITTGLLYRFQWNQANQFLNDWLGQAPDNTAALMLLGKLQENRLQHIEARVAFRRVLEIDPRHDEARLRLASLLLLQRQGEEALRHLEYLRHRLPENAEVRVQWVQALGLQGRTAEARAALDDCLRDFPNDPRALAERGRYAELDGDDAAAEGYFGLAARLDPGGSATRHQYAQVLARNGKKAEAEREQAAVRQLKADSDRITQLIQGPLQENPNDPAVHHEIGMIALRSGQPDEAVRWFQSALRVGPDYLPTHRMLAAFYHESGNPILAAKHRAIAQRLKAQHP